MCARAEKLVAKQTRRRPPDPLLRVKNDKTRDVLRLEEELSDLLAATVEIRVKKRTKRGVGNELAVQLRRWMMLSGLLDSCGAEFGRLSESTTLRTPRPAMDTITYSAACASLRCRYGPGLQ